MENRQDIITRYRDRIATGERTKLTQEEMHQLIETFLEQLQGLTTQDEIRALCEAEITLLEEGYPKATIGKVYVPLYRKSIKAAMAEGKLPMTETTSRQYTYTKRESGETGEAHDHRSLDFLKYDNATYSAIAGKSAERNNEKQDNLKPVNPDAYLAKAAELLQSHDPFELAVGLAATTGRRFSEVVDKGKLLATDQPYWISFSGQLKKKKKATTDSYLTPCLVTAADVMAALARFRNHPRIARVIGASARDINRSLANSVKRAVHKHFGATGIIPVLEGEADTTIHNLRGVYGEICVHFFCPPSRGVARFVQERLGHVISDEELKRGNASATQHYFHYYLIDSNGKHIGSRGVKLTDDEPLPTLIEHTSESQPEILPEMQPTQQPEATSAITTLTKQMATLTQEMQRLWSYVENMSTQQPQAPITTDTTFFTREIENLRSQLAALKQERDQAATALEQVQEEKESLLQRFAQERQAYQQRIEGLTELLKQTPTTAQPAPAQPVETTVTAVEATVARPQTQPLTSVQPTPLKPKRDHITKAGSADQRVEASMRAIMDWNRQHDSDAAKFAITQSLLQKTTGSNMPAVKRVMEAFKDEIYEHNSEYALDKDRHNYGKEIEAVKRWVEERG